MSIDKKSSDFAENKGICGPQKRRNRTRECSDSVPVFSPKISCLSGSEVVADGLGCGADQGRTVED
ncbi:MAG: hypothetical protein IKY91_05465, partial [Akkermansia sp.]|nr:hypothetical protein [Akkermansia sp.]